MNNQTIKSLSKICTGQTVFLLLVSCMILWIYVLPVAFQEVINQAGIPSIKNNIVKSLFFGELSIISKLNEDVRNIYATAECTAGIFENVTTFALILSFQFFVLLKIKNLDTSYKYFIYILSLGFVADLLQSFGIIYLMLDPSSIDYMMYFIKFFFILKLLIYLLSTFHTTLKWYGSS